MLSRLPLKPLLRSPYRWKLISWPGLRMRMHVVAFALWFKATLARNRNPKWIARELQLARGRNG
jgi:hypothetical protein